MAAFRDRLVKSLTDTSRNNPALYFRTLKTTLALPPLDNALIRDLLAGETLTAAVIEGRGDVDEVRQTTAGEAASPSNSTKPSSGRGFRGGLDRRSDVTRRLEAIRKKAQMLRDERNIETLYAAIGFLRWRSDDGGRDANAPLFITSVDILPNPRRRSDYVLARSSDRDIVVNPSLLHAVPAELAQRLAAIGEASTVDEFDAAFRTATAAIAEYHQFQFVPECAIGTFAFQWLAAVQDLAGADALLEGSLLARALAGDEAARLEIAAGLTGEVGLHELDAISAVNEPFVVDTDPWQAQTIHTVLRFPDSSIAIQGPPGTGKSQTVAGTIAALIAAGRRVLFVAEKREALDVVLRRLKDVGLAHLVLPLHGQNVTRSKVYGELRLRYERLAHVRPGPSTETETLFDVLRENLNAHAAFINTPLECGLSPYALMGEALRLPVTDLRWNAPTLTTLDQPTFDRIHRAIAEIAAYPEMLRRTDDALWARAAVDTDDEAWALRDRVSGLRARIAGLLTLLAAYKRPRTLAELREDGSAVARLLRVLEVFHPTIFTVDAVTRRAAIEATRSSWARFLAIFPGTAKRAIAAVDDCVRRAVSRETLHDLLRLVDQIPADLVAIADRKDLPARDQIERELAEFPKVLATVQTELGEPLAEIGDLRAIDGTLGALLADQVGVFRTVRVRNVESQLGDLGIGDLLPHLAERPPTDWTATWRAAWINSHLDSVFPDLARFDGRRHDEIVVRFAAADDQRIANAAQRVARRAAERFVEAVNAEPREKAIFLGEVNRRRGLAPVRDLFAKAPTIAPALAPCIMASPISVSQLLPQLQMFDAVIFDEASQVVTETAIGAIIRGRRAIVAGDRHQLPPTSFFQLSHEYEEEEDADDEASDAAMNAESLLDAMQPFARNLDLRVHYRSRDERLIAFSNWWIYKNLITFPSDGAGGDAIKYVHVADEPRDGDEESNGAEVQRVVEMILEHAEVRPHESLGVIAPGLKHANRIDAALALARADRTDLDEFFSDTATDARFFIKNIERIQGDERDAIILSFGYGRTHTGRFSHNFGPIGQRGGERRLNVAITRAKNRVTVVSSFRSGDLDPTRLTSTGAKLVAAYLKYAETGGRDLGRAQSDEAVELNPFEMDVKATLERQLGLSVVPQLGVSGFRIDLVAQHPDRPGEYILAIECDGASYHSSPTARMRDRLRQRVLEDRGFEFCRIWSTDWFLHRDKEIARVHDAYRLALAAKDAGRAIPHQDKTAATEPEATATTEPEPRRVGPAPLGRVARISDVTVAQLVRLYTWLASDGMLRTDDQLFEEAFEHLGFSRRGGAIVRGLQAALTQYHRK